MAVKEGEAIDKLVKLREAICIFTDLTKKKQAKMNSEVNSCLILLIR